jgi:hypothetical protein
LVLGAGYMMLDAGYWVLDAGYWMLEIGRLPVQRLVQMIWPNFIRNGEI